MQTIDEKRVSYVILRTISTEKPREPLGNCRKCLIPKDLCKTTAGLENEEGDGDSAAFSYS